MAKIAIVCFSGCGHTKKQAEAVHRGAASKLSGTRVAEYAAKTRQ